MKAHEIGYQIYGDDMQVVEVELDPGETVVAEAGMMNWMEDGITFETKMGDGSQPQASLLDKLLSAGKRAITGESLFMTHFSNSGSGKKRVAFAAPYPGKIVAFDLDQFSGQVLCQRDSFLCAARGTEIEVAFTKRLGAGFFGGEGFILQKLSGNGMVFVHAGGTVVEKDLVAGETLRVDTGCLVAFAMTVDYDIQFVGGFKNALFGGEGLFFAKMTGPGKVYLQSLPFSRLVDRIKRGITFTQSGGEQKGVAGIGGDILKNIISGS